jgi:predicted PurR-regulated permease PerM
MVDVPVPPPIPGARPPRADVPAPRAVLRIVGIVLIVVVTLYLVYLLRKPIGWLVIATFLAVALSAPINLLSRWMKRGFAVLLVYLGLLLVPVAIGLLIVPPIVREANQLVDDLPGYVSDVRDFTEKDKTLQRLESDYGITTKLEDEAQKLPDKLGGAAGTLGDIGLGLVNSLFAALNILILSIFMVAGGRRWLDWVIRQQPPEHQPRLRRILDQVRRAVASYVGGALLQATIAGVATYLVLTVLGVPFAGPLAVLTFLLDLIPLVGATVAAVAVGLVTVFNDFPTTTIIWTVWAIVYQQVENNVIQPRIQSKAVNVEGFFVLVSVLFGATLFGIAGALLAIPVAATAQILLAEWLAYRRELRNDPAAAASSRATG